MNGNQRMRAAKWLGRGQYLNNVFGGVPGSEVGGWRKGQEAKQHRLKLRSVSSNTVSKVGCGEFGEKAYENGAIA